MATTTQINSAFDIRDYQDQLEPASEKDKYICPSCGGHNLSIAESGAYQCFNGCTCKEIRDILSPPRRRRGLEEVTRKPRTNQKSRRTEPVSAPLEVPSDLTLVRLPEAPFDIPTPQTRLDPKLGEISETTYIYAQDSYWKPKQWVVRSEWADAEKAKGRSKKFCQWHSKDGQRIPKKGDEPWQLYRLEETSEGIKTTTGTPVVLMQEGEKPVELARGIGLVSNTLQGSNWSVKNIVKSLEPLADIPGPNICIAFLRDNDAVGEKKSNNVEEACNQLGFHFVDIDPAKIYPDIIESGDIAEILQAMSAPEFIRQLEQEIHNAASAKVEAAREALLLMEEAESTSKVIGVDVEFTQKALAYLYSDKPWICANDKLYFWNGTGYKHSIDAIERPKIASFCNKYKVKYDDGSTRYPYAKPSKVREALQWVKDRLEVDPALLNPPGLNCTNGVLQILWNGDKPQPTLIDHDPALYYTYEPVITYKPDANPTHCNRLLEVLDLPQREVFLRTIAASLDLTTVRKYKGRLVRTLLLKGHGSNGKDALRECVAAMYGYQAITSATLSDFAAYDQGRKFPLARLINSRVNWASENANTDKLDKIQSLKAFVTGDPLDSEGKGKDEHEFTPVGIALFNCNDTPNLQASLQAIKDRYGVLTFDKTFKINADTSKNELEADPRFKYDPEFLRSEVLPAFLNKVLEALNNLMADGIDYGCTQQALEDIQAENSHLFQFCRDVGLGYQPGSTTSAGEIWEKLEEWYLNDGTLSYEESANGKLKAIWSDQANPRDRNCKAAHQVPARFLALFPKAKRVGIGKGKVGLQGIGFARSGDDDFSPLGEATVLKSEPRVGLSVSLQSAPSKDGEAIAPISHSTEKKYVEKEEEERKEEHCSDKEYNHLPLEGQQAHHPLPEPITASPIASPTSSNEALIASPTTPMDEIEEGDRVAGADPYSRNYSWIGEVVKVKAEEILVVWQEGEGITLLIPRSYQRSELRRV